jgi:hypothetical protein
MRRRWKLVAPLGAAVLAAGVIVAATQAGSHRSPLILGPQFGKGESAQMSGTVEVPAGDPDGTGTAEIRLDPNTALVCFQIDVTNVDFPVLAAHIHRAPTGVAGPVVVPLDPPQQLNGGATAESRGCKAADPALIQDIINNPSQYYVNVHNAKYPAGIIRGQLTTIVDKAKAKPKAKPKAKKHKKKKKKGH